MAKIFSLLILSLILIGFLFISIIVAGIIHFSKDLPDYNQLAEYKPPIVSRLHTGDGSFLAEFSSQNRAFVPYASMPKRVVDAFIAAEDKNFFNHKGIDIRGIVRASLTNLKNLSKLLLYLLFQNILFLEHYQQRFPLQIVCKIYYFL